MERFSICMTFFGIIIAVALMQCAAAQTVHVVGDNLGWTVPQNGATAYSNWAASKRFMVGDILVFNFTTNVHDVLEVPRASFDECSDDNAIGTTLTNGPANFTLSSSGQHYYICTIGQHCQLGQRLSITVSGTSGSPLPAPSPTTTTTPTTPSPTSGTPANCTPTPTSGPTAGSTPPSGSVPGSTGTPNSSWSAVFASLLLSMLAIVMGLIF